MQENKNAIERSVLIETVRLDAMVLGLASGLVVGLGIFMATIILLLKGGEPVGPNLALLGQFFLGYRVTYGGSLIGFVYSLLFGFIVGYMIANLYNWLANFREKRRTRSR